MSLHGNRKLNKPFRTPSASKKFGVFVRNRKTGRVQIVRFGSKRLSIKKNIPSRKKNYCSRSSGIKGAKDKFSANYWSRKAWNC